MPPKTKMTRGMILATVVVWTMLVVTLAVAYVVAKEDLPSGRQIAAVLPFLLVPALIAWRGFRSPDPLETQSSTKSSEDA